MSTGRGRAAARVAAALAAAVTFATAPAPLTAQDTGVESPRPPFDVQLADDQGTYPVGHLFVRGLDSIWTAADTVIAGGSILIREGIIEAIGTGLEAPEGVPVVEGAGLTAIPGLVDEHSHTAMIQTNEGTAPIVPEVRVLDALDAGDFDIYRALSGGVTTARVMHGSANPIGGQSAVIKMRWGMDASRELLVPGAPRFVKFALGENVTQANARDRDRPLRFPASRPGVEALYVEAFTAASEYVEAWSLYQENPDAYRAPPRRDLRLEALADILAGRIRVHAHSYRSDEILMLMRVAERFGFRIDVFTHVLEGYKVAPELAAHGASAATFSDWWQYKLEAMDAIPYNAALLHEAGVRTALNSDLSWLQSFMVHEMAKPVKYGGVSREEALRMLTLNPARMMYIDDKVGSLEVGKQGDVVLLDGDPFDTYSRVQKTVVDGIVYYDLENEEGTRGEPFLPVPGLESEERPLDDGPTPEPVVPPGGGGTFEADVPPMEARSFALVGGTVHPVTSESISDGIVVVRNGRITAVGSTAEIPPPGDVVVVDASGRHVYPGLVDGMTTLGLFEFGPGANASDIEGTGRYGAHLRSVSSVRMDNPAIPVARMGGITSAFTSQRTGVVQGTGAVLQLRGRTWEEGAVVAEAALVVDFPAPRRPEDEPSGGAPPPADPVPALEGDDLEELVELFERARMYAAEGSVRPQATEPLWPNREPPDRMLLEGLAPVLLGERPVLFRADTAWQLRTLFLFLDRFPEVRPVVVGGAEGYRVADELARREIPVILTNSLAPARSRDESVTAPYRNASVLERAGVTIGFGTDRAGEDGLTRNLPYHAAQSVAFGLSPEAGLRAVTLGAAEALGVGRLLGSLDVGKRADLIVTDGDPLQMLTSVERMWIGGTEVDLADNRHRRLYEQYRGIGGSAGAAGATGR